MQAPITKSRVETVKHEAETNGVDMVAISRILLRILAHLEEVEYTDSHIERQAEVLAHDDPPDPTRDMGTTRD